MKWDERFLDLAALVATWSKDPNTQVGAVIVEPDTHRVISLGYNGLPHGVEDDPEVLDDRNRKLACTIHAENNAILFANRSLVGCHIYIHPMFPCAHCAAQIIQVGISRVVTREMKDVSRWEYSFGLARNMFRQAGVEFVIM